MSRVGLALLLGVSGCAWLTEDDDAPRLDRDGDGIPKAYDCNDDQDDVQQMFANGGEIACGESVCGAFEGVRVPDEWQCDRTSVIEIPVDPEDGTLEEDLQITNCLHPLYSDRLLQVSRYEHSYRLDVTEPLSARITLQQRQARSSLPIHVVPEHAVLVLNRGPICTRDTCVPGLPLIGEDRSDATVRSAITAQPGEDVFIVASGREGAYRLTVQCDVVAPDGGPLP